MKLLIPIEQLIASREKYEAEQVAERLKQFAVVQAEHEKAKRLAAAQTPVPKTKFNYQARTPEQWRIRAEQGKRDGRRWRGRR